MSLLLMLAFLLTSCGATEGPLAYEGSPDGTLISARVGQAVSWANLFIGREGTSFELEKVELVSSPDGLQLVGAGLAPLLVKPLPYVGESFPPRPRLSFLPTSISGEMRLVIGLRADSEGLYDARAIRLVYRDGGREYATEYPHSVRLCVGEASWLSSGCVPPEPPR